jgi:hypothetical protein
VFWVTGLEMFQWVMVPVAQEHYLTPEDEGITIL